jgi:hypothetical protein
MRPATTLAGAKDRIVAGTELLIGERLDQRRSQFHCTTVKVTWRAAPIAYSTLSSARLSPLTICNCVVTTRNNVDSCALSTAFAARISSASSGAL